MMNTSKAPEACFLIWLDMEMSGLDPDAHRILEVAALITDLDVSTKHGSLERVVFQPPEVLSAMDDWCKKTHRKSGLTAKIPDGVTEAEADEALCALLDQPGNPPGRPILAGNSISQDRKFIDRYLPKFAARLHYRMLDVSSFKVIFEHRLGFKYQKANKHRAIDDIGESIEELNFYLSMCRFDPGLAKGVQPE
jgi:oligoribonuclease